MKWKKIQNLINTHLCISNFHNLNFKSSWIFLKQFILNIWTWISMKMKIYCDKGSRFCEKWYIMKVTSGSSCLKFKLSQHSSTCLLNMFTFPLQNQYNINQSTCNCFKKISKQFLMSITMLKNHYLHNISYAKVFNIVSE